MMRQVVSSSSHTRRGLDDNVEGFSGGFFLLNLECDHQKLVPQISLRPPKRVNCETCKEAYERSAR